VVVTDSIACNGVVAGRVEVDAVMVVVADIIISDYTIFCLQKL